MPSYNRPIVKRNESNQVVLEYAPKKFPFKMAELVSDFVELNPQHGAPGKFRMNELIAERTGFADVERQSAEDLVEARALEKLKEIQESAYKEAYDLGLEEGRKNALAKFEGELTEQVKKFGELFDTISTIKQDLVNSNEAQIVKLIYYIANRIAMNEIEQNPEAILSVLKGTIGEGHSEEHTSIRLSTQDFKLITETKEQLASDFDFLKNARLIEDPEVLAGGCVIETNFGVIDATLQERVNHLMETLFEAAPKRRDSIAS